MPEAPAGAHEPVAAELAALRGRHEGENPAHIRRELAAAMMDDCGVFRTDEGLRKLAIKVRELKERFARARVQDRGMVFNTDLLEAWEVGYLLDCAEATVHRRSPAPRAAAPTSARTIPTGTTSDWLKHTLATRADGGPQLAYKPVSITRFQPKPRTY